MEKDIKDLREFDSVTGRLLPKCGEVWRHFKNKFYTIKGIAICADNDCTRPESEKKYVVYTSHENGVDYVRNLNEFMSKVDRNKYPADFFPQDYRFVAVSC